MNPFSSDRMLITQLSHIHVGTGESYEPTNYVIEEGVLHEFDTSAVMAALSDADYKQLLETGGRRPDAAMIEALQRFFHERRKTLMEHTLQRIPVLLGVANLYKQRIGQTANREADGKKVLNRLDIDEILGKTCFILKFERRIFEIGVRFRMDVQVVKSFLKPFLR